MSNFAFITLNEAKLQCRIEVDDYDYDADLSELVLDATALVASEINRKVYHTDADLQAAISDGTAPEYAISLETEHKGQIVKRLTKLLVAHFFVHRSPVSAENAKSVFLTYKHALDQVRLFSV